MIDCFAAVFLFGDWAFFFYDAKLYERSHKIAARTAF